MAKGPVQLTGSVGRPPNNIGDVISVGALLDKFIGAGLLPPIKLLTVLPNPDGVTIPDSKMQELVKRIKQFETLVEGVEYPPGFVTRSGSTIGWLNKSYDEVKAQIQKVRSEKLKGNKDPGKISGDVELIGTVGLYSKNDVGDVVAVGILLDKFIGLGLLPPLTKLLTIIPDGSGNIPPAKLNELIHAIKLFEAIVVGAEYSPGFVTPKGPTIKWLNAGVEDVKLQIKRVKERRIADKSVAEWTDEEKFDYTLRATQPYISVEAWNTLETLLTPEALAIMTATTTVWAASHFIGVGEVADLVVVIVAASTLGMSALEAIDQVFSCVLAVRSAKHKDDLDRGAKHLAKAINLVGVEAISAILFKRRARPYKGAGKLKPAKLPADPGLLPGRAGGLAYKPTINPTVIPEKGVMGYTTKYGDIYYDVRYPDLAKRAAILHEKVHSALTPKLYFMREFRANLRMGSLNKSATLLYIEEMWAETVSLIGTQGVRSGIKGFSFPVKNGYVTVSEICIETAGHLMGPVNVAGKSWVAYKSESNPHDW